MTHRRFQGFHSFLQVAPPEHHVEIPKPKNLFRVICLGGSTTAGDYPKILGELLSQKYPQNKIEVINAGHYFYSTQHSIIQYLFDLKEFDPDLIIFFEGINDLIASFTMPKFSSSPFRKDYGHFYGVLANLLYPRTFEQFLSGFFYADLRRPDLKPIAFTDFKSLYAFRRNLETLIQTTQCYNIHLIISNQAHCFTDTNKGNINFLEFVRDFLVDKDHYADEKSWYEGMELFNKTAEQTAAKFSIPFVDQAAAFRGKQHLFTDSVHMTPEATELKASLFFEKIVQLKLLGGN